MKQEAAKRGDLVLQSSKSSVESDASTTKSGSNVVRFSIDEGDFKSKVEDPN